MRYANDYTVYTHNSVLVVVNAASRFHAEMWASNKAASSTLTGLAFKDLCVLAHPDKRVLHLGHLCASCKRCYAHCTCKPGAFPC